MSKRALKRGRRPGLTTTRDSIRQHAASAFAQSGFEGVTVRQIAASAGVDPALIHHYFGTKRALFEVSLEVAGLSSVAALDRVSAHERTSGTDPSPGERIVRDFLATWDGPGERATIAGLLRTASTDAQARTLLTDVIARTIVAPTIAAIDASRGMPKLRAALIAAQLFGIAWMRYVLATEPIASASPQILSRSFGPSVDATLHGTDYRRA